MEIRPISQQQFGSYKSKVSKGIEKVIQKGEILPEEASELSQQIQKKILPQRCCGIGMHGAVYKIDDYYVVKVPSRKDAYDKIEINEGIVKPFFESLKTYYGEALARIKEFYILKNVSTKEKKHIPLGIPLELYINTPTYKLYKPENIDKLREYYRTTSLPMLAHIPQKSYDDIAEDCAKLNKMGDENNRYTFDYKNPNNFVIVGSHLRIIDAIYKNTEINKPLNSIPSLLSVFLNRIGFELPAKYDEKFTPMRRLIFQKVILAGIKNNLPVNNTASGESVYKIALKLTDIKNINADQLEETLKAISLIPQEQTRVFLTKQLLRSTFHQNPIYKSNAQ